MKNPEENLKKFQPVKPENPDKLKSQILGEMKKEAKKYIPFYKNSTLLTIAASILMLVTFAAIAAPSLLAARRGGNAGGARGRGSSLFEWIGNIVSNEKSSTSVDLSCEYDRAAIDCNRMIAPAITCAPNSNIANPEGEPVGETQYDAPSRITENQFFTALSKPFSTFSIDVDTASYSMIRNRLHYGMLPEKSAVRIEEMINYFSYDYPQPTDEHPFSISTEYAPCPWNPEHKLALIGLQGLKIDLSEAPASNLVFLIDVSGSMGSPEKLPLLKQAFELLLEGLRDKDKVAMVVYAGASGLVLDSTPGNMKEEIRKALNSLTSGGSTAGAKGIRLAYNIASENFIKGGNNRVILATDGDFNVGISSVEGMKKLIEKKREEGVFLSVLGFGMGNYRDSIMETLADNGNGNYAYIDSLKEAQKVFVNEFGGTLFTIAKDVKIQVEFNPAYVSSYRLIGYENRMLKKKDFKDDKRDAGELGSGHCVTALYEIIPATKNYDNAKLNSGKYVSTTINESAYSSEEIMTVRFRYKKPDENQSHLISHVLKLPAPDMILPENIVFASAVAEFGLLLSDSAYKGSNSSIAEILLKARASCGSDPNGYRAEFIELVELYQKILDKKK